MKTISFFGSSRSDFIGVLSGSLCLIHCAATPLLFLVSASSVSCASSSPLWWSIIDYVFIAISFLAIWFSVKSTSLVWIKYGLWISWFIFAFFLIAEKMDWISKSSGMHYYPALCLIVLHLYNGKYCTCKEDECYPDINSN